MEESEIGPETNVLKGSFGVNGSSEVDGEGGDWRSSARTTKAGVPLV